MNKMYGVVFKETNKVYYFQSEDDFEINSLAVVDGDVGEQIVKIVQILSKNKDENNASLKRKATEEDYNNYLNNLKDADRALKKCIEFVKNMKLDMNVINAQYNLDKTQLLFNFTADGRVDFRELAKKLASIYHTRIELRQIGARDKAKEVGGIGICGGKLCCVRFLKKINAISMNMAKNQNLALNPNKINGACGRLLCCLSYEDDQYVASSAKLPKVGEKISTLNGEGTVVSVDILNERYKVLVDGEKIEYDLKSEK